MNVGMFGIATVLIAVIFSKLESRSKIALVLVGMLFMVILQLVT